MKDSSVSPLLVQLVFMSRKGQMKERKIENLPKKKKNPKLNVYFYFRVKGKTEF